MRRVSSSILLLSAIACAISGCVLGIRGTPYYHFDRKTGEATMDPGWKEFGKMPLDARNR